MTKQGTAIEDKDGNYTPLHINIAPCSGMNNKQNHELSEGQTQITNDKQTSEIEEQSQHAIETGELQPNQVQRTQVDNRLAQVDNRLEVSTLLGGEACVICRKSDHTTIECQAVRRPGWCFICGKLDHDTPHCLDKYKAERKGSNGQSANTCERQPVIPPPRYTQVNANPFLTQNQMQECGYVQIQEKSGKDAITTSNTTEQCNHRTTREKILLRSGRARATGRILRVLSPPGQSTTNRSMALPKW